MRNLKTGIIYIYFLLRITTVYSQAPEIDWQISSGGSDWDVARSIAISPDSGYIIAGYTRSIDGDITLNQGVWDFWLTKFNKEGILESQHTYGGSASDYAHCIKNVGDGYVMAGYTYSTDGDVIGNHGLADAWVIKIDYSGNLIWEKCYGGTLGDYANSIEKTADGGYIVAATSYSNDGDVAGNHGEGDYWVFKIDESGNLQWQKCFGGSGLEFVNDIIQISDSNYIVAGTTSSFDGDVGLLHGSFDYWIVKLNNEGVLLWERSYGGSDVDEPYSILETSDKELILAGYTESSDGDITFYQGDFDVWIVKTDSTGELLNQKTFGGSGEEQAYSININNNNDFVVCGYTASDDGDVTFNNGIGDYWLFVIDTNLVIKWQKSLGGTELDFDYTTQETFDGGYLCTGYSNSNDGDVSGNHGEYDFWTVKLQKPCAQTVYYFDVDEDTFGDPSNYFYSCEDTSGYVLNNLDCNDLNASINPLSEEVCNNNDDNCDGLIDNGLTFTNYFLDADNDTYGNFDVDTLWCNPVEGYITDSTDCDDSNPLINPGMAELLNDLDDDCDGLSDEGLSTEDNLMEQVSIYPNPTIDALYLSFPYFNLTQIEIFDISGKLVLHQTTINNFTQIKVGNLSSGLYTLKISSSGNVAFSEFIKE